MDEIWKTAVHLADRGQTILQIDNKNEGRKSVSLSFILLSYF